MSYKKIVKNSDGSFDMYDWSIGHDIAAYFIKNFTMILSTAIFYAIIPLLTPFFVPISVHSDRVGAAVLSLIFSFLFILDFHFGWFIHAFMSEDFSNFYTTFSALHLSSMIISTLILIGGEKNVNQVIINCSSNPFLVWLSTGAMYLATYKVITYKLILFIGMAEPYMPFAK